MRNSMNWHINGIKGPVRPEDVIVAAFVQLRRLSVSLISMAWAPTSAPSPVVASLFIADRFVDPVWLKQKKKK